MTPKTMRIISYMLATFVLIFGSHEVYQSLELYNILYNTYPFGEVLKAISIKFLLVYSWLIIVPSMAAVWLHREALNLEDTYKST